MAYRKLTTKLKNNKKLKTSSAAWLKRQLNDPYVLQAQKEGFRSRAAYKLLEIDTKFKLINKHSVVLDLGAAPGSWSQVAISRNAKNVIAVDLLAIDPMDDLDFIQGDFTDDAILNKILESCKNHKINLILSDMAPNISGNRTVDNSRMDALVEIVLNFALDHLSQGGAVVIKVFQNGSERSFYNTIKMHFNEAKIFKPLASRKESAEIYMVGIGFKGK